MTKNAQNKRKRAKKTSEKKNFGYKSGKRPLEKGNKIGWGGGGKMAGKSQERGGGNFWRT